MSALLDKLDAMEGRRDQQSASAIDTNTPPPKPDDAMLYGLVGDVARAAAKDTEVNPIAAAMNYLSFLGAHVGRDVHLQVGNTWHHANIFTLQVGRSGRGRKGDSIALVHRIRRRMEEAWAGTLGQTHTGGLSSREGLALLIHDGFKEGKTEHEPIHDKRLWVVESEFANILHQGKRDGNTLSAALRDGWDGIDIKPAIKSGRVWASKPHIGLACAITPGELTGLIASRELMNGFANRFLMTWAERTGLVPFPQPTPKPTLDELTEHTTGVIRFAKGNYPAEPDTREMRLSEAARELYEVAYRKELNRPEASDLLTALLERRAPYVLRLAMLFALTDKSLVIEKHHLEAALAWVRYARDSVRFIFAEQAGIAEAEERADLARKILAFLRGRPEGADKTTLINECFKKKVSASQIDAALKGLMLANPPRVEIETIPRKDGAAGKSRTIYRLFPCNARGISGERGESDLARDVEFSDLAELGGDSFSCLSDSDLSPLSPLTPQIDVTSVESLSPISPLSPLSVKESADLIEVTI